jgi:hypothetical protein
MMHQIEDFLSRGVAGRLLALAKSSRPATRAAWAALRLYQDVTGATPNEHRQLREMEPAPPAGDGPRVLIFSLRGWTAHLAWETTVARALHVRGAGTLTVLCDRVLPACEPRTVLDDYPSTCDRCMSQSGRFLEETGLPYTWLSEYVTPDEVDAFARQTANLDYDALGALMGEGLPVGELIGASVNRHLLGGAQRGDPAHFAATRRFAAAGLVAAAAVERLLDDYRPDAVLVMNGLFYAEAILMTAARRRGITAWSYERGKRGGGLIFGRDTPVLRQDFAERWAERAQTPLTDAQAAALDTYLGGRTRGNVGIERIWPEMEAVEPPESGKPTAVLFTNVLWDTAVYQTDIGFESMAEWVVETIRWFEAHPEKQLVVRVHPAEVRLPFKTSQEQVLDRVRAALPILPPNVRIVPPESAANSYALLDAADVALVYTSTVGLEAALRGIPTVVAGRVHYRSKGFTLDPDTPDGYAGVLDMAFARGQLSEADIQLAQRYAYLYFFEEIIPFEAVEEGPRSYVTFHYRRSEALAPGRDRALDAICDALLGGQPLRNPYA